MVVFVPSSMWREEGPRGNRSALLLSRCAREDCGGEWECSGNIFGWVFQGRYERVMFGEACENLAESVKAKPRNSRMMETTLKGRGFFGARRRNK